MNFERLRWGEWLAAFAALDLLLVTFRAWYEVTGGGARVTAWDALEQGRYLLIATAVAGIVLWLLKASDDPPRLSIPLGWVAAAIGFACTVYIAYRLATPPADNLDAALGLYLGLAAALGVTIGGLLSARDEAAEPGYVFPTADEDSAPAGDPHALVPDSGNTWSPARPTASTAGWSPAAPAALPPAATAAAVEAGAGRSLQSGDSVVLTAGGARFPAGTVAEVVEVFGGGALVEVKASDGMAERFEVPESAYERAPAGGAALAGDDWSPGMPAPAGEDWGFDDPAGASVDQPDPADADAVEGKADGAADKVPWWKREIGGGKKKKDEAIEAGAVGAVAAGAGAIAAHNNGSGEQKPGFFKRLFGGGADKADDDTETIEGEPTPATDVAGLGQAAESDTAVDEATAESAVDEPAADAAVDEPAVDEPAAGAAVDEPAAAGPAAEPAVDGPAPEAAVDEPAAAGPAAESTVDGPAPEAAVDEPAADPDIASAAAASSQPPTGSGDAAEPEVAEPQIAAAEPEPEPPSPPQSEPVASEPEAVAPEPAPEATASEAEIEPVAPEPEPTPPAAAAEPTPRRKRSSGNRTVPKEALAAAAAGEDAHPKVGDEVQLKVGGGRYDAGTKGTVVDVFSAGVIVELSDDDGRTERLDLPFEAIGPADA